MTDPYSPAQRAAFLRSIDQQEQRERFTAAAVPARSGELPRDLAEADAAVERIEAEWDQADAEFRAARGAAGPLPSMEAQREIVHLEQRAGELWELRRLAVRNRDQLLDRFDAHIRAARGR